MAAEWHYVVDRKQSGPVDLLALIQLRESGALSSGDLVFGPGLAEWTPAGRVAELCPADKPAPMAGNATGVAMDISTDIATDISTVNVTDIPTGEIAAGGVPTNAGMLAYRSAETGAAGISRVTIGLFRDTKPWARAVAIVMFIGCGALILVGLGVSIFLAFNVKSVVGAAVGLIYVAFGALFLIPAIFLNRYATAIGVLLRTNRMSDLEQAIRSQKSYWKFMGMMMLVILCIYAVIIVIAILGRM